MIALGEKVLKELKQKEYDKWKQIEAEGPKVGQLWSSDCAIWEILDTLSERVTAVKLIASAPPSNRTGINVHIGFVTNDCTTWNWNTMELFKDVNPTITVRVNPVLQNKDIVNAIHNPDAPSTNEELQRAWDVTRLLCRGG